MSKIIIEASSTYMAEDSVMALLKGKFVAHTARISYNPSKGLPLVEDIDNYPLILEGELGISSVSIYVTSVTAGYGGTGPHTMLAILKAAGFVFSESDILTNRFADANGQIKLTYTR